ncbi:MAG: thioredoxin [Puniceicoccales bacterium]|jgi:thioredoxin 1|nr:thioredoxin [Puniceicoccales bacterium]
MKALDATNFDETLGQNSIVVVDFWAPWCGPCRALAPVIEQVAEEVGESTLVAKVNVDEASQLGERFGVQSIPTIIYFRNGLEAERSVGMTTKADIMATLNSL